MPPLPDLLPLFPLEVVVYPDEPIPLHIFEPRYREMVAYCLDEEQPFGIVRSTDDGIAPVGCSVRIRRVLTRYADGRLDIAGVGEERFRVLDVYNDRAYLTAEVEPYGPPVEPAALDVRAREAMIARHMKLLEMAGEPLRPAAYEAARWASFVVARNAGLEPDEKQRVLEMATENERVRFLVRHVGEVLLRVERARKLTTLARGDGHGTGFPDLGAP